MKNFSVVFIGVHTFYGRVTGRVDTTVTMEDVREVLRWEGAAFPFGLAANGVAYPDMCRITARVPHVVLWGVTRILGMTDEAVASLDAVPDITLVDLEREQQLERDRQKEMTKQAQARTPISGVRRR